MTSIGANFLNWDGKKYVSNKGEGDGKRGFNPTPTIQGKMYHRIGPLEAKEGQDAKFGQIYFVDGDMSDQADQRLKVFHNFNVSEDKKVKKIPLGKKC